MGVGRNGKSLMGIPWKWELVTKLGMGMGRNGNRLHGNGRDWECKKPLIPGHLCRLCTGGVLSRCAAASSVSELSDVRQLDSLFILHSLLAELSAPDSPAYASYCLTAYAVVMQIWQVRRRGYLFHAGTRTARFKESSVRAHQICVPHWKRAISATVD